MAVRREVPLQLGPPPRADLLPAEIRSDRTWRTTRTGLILAGVASILVSALIGGSAMLDASRSAAEVEQLRTSNQRLLAKSAGYANVTAIEAAIKSASAAQAAASTDWIDWQRVLGRVVKAMPEGMTLTTATATTAATATATAGSTPTTAPSSGSTSAPTGTVATLALGASTRSLSAVQTWIGAMGSMPGYLEADPGSVAAQSDGTLKVTVNLYLDRGTYSARRLVPVPISTAMPTVVPAPTTAPSAPSAASSTAPSAAASTSTTTLASGTPLACTTVSDPTSGSASQTLVCTSGTSSGKTSAIAVPTPAPTTGAGQ